MKLESRLETVPYETAMAALKWSSRPATLYAEWIGRKLWALHGSWLS